MQFILSKILYYLFYPFNWVIILVFCSFFIKKITLRKKINLAAIVIFLLFSNKYLFNKICVAYQPKQIQIASLANYNVGIILGGLSSYDKNNIGYFGESSDRFIQTLQLYKLGKIKKIIVTGGSAKLLFNEKDEASFLYTTFINCGVNENDIIIEKKARNTEENMIFSKTILDSLKVKNDVLIITSAFHAKRSAYIAKKLGVTNYLVFPSNYIEINSNESFIDLTLPNMKTLNQWGFLIKEWVGLITYKLTY